MVTATATALPTYLQIEPVAEGVEPTWNSAGFEAFRDQLDSATPPEICRSCSIYTGTF